MRQLRNSMSTEPPNDHGWTSNGIGTIRIAGTDSPVAFSTGPIVDAFRRCGCRWLCCREATEEDLLCDECRDTCGGTP